MANEIKSLMLDGPAGKLEALLNAGAPNATHTALISHPHPLFGGTMHNKVVYNAMKALASFGFPTLRFNFRGTGRSEGKHNEGKGEVEDVRAALEFLHNEFHLPIIFAGFSFGAATGMRAACPDEHVVAIISLGTPVVADGRTYAYKFLASCAKPKLFVSGSQDQYSPARELQEVVNHAAEPKKLVLIEGAEHFFMGKLELMQSAIQEWVREAVL